MKTMTKNITSITPVHLPDLHFIQFCEKEFNVNRGIYNTIDTWFFNYGIKNLLERRQTIIYFLQNLNEIRKKNNTTKIKFGSGGLTSSLTEFCQTNHL
ncbi:hypothetical protein [Metabacillus sediminilitoris]|nr:hypothetical protein [Metabacillus sediminilitoris]